MKIKISKVAFTIRNKKKFSLMVYNNNISNDSKIKFDFYFSLWFICFVCAVFFTLANVNNI